MPTEWIVIPKWDEFQHYRDRDPLWIKVYTRLVHNDDWHSLTYAERGLLVTIWLEYALSDGVLSAVKVRSMVHRNMRQRALESLQAKGWIQLSASKPLANRYHRARDRKDLNRDMKIEDLLKDIPSG